MSWDRINTDKYSNCACGQGRVIKHCWQEYDDWNRSRNGVLGYDIECPNCKNNYHISSITRHYACPSWKSDGISTDEYLVPNGIVLPKVITPTIIQTPSADAEIVSLYSADTITDVIDDMENNRYSTRVCLRESKDIINICNKRLQTKSLNKIVPYLKEILDKYDTYKWNPVTIAEYKRIEQTQIQNNENEIARVVSKSVLLDFQ